MFFIFRLSFSHLDLLDSPSFTLFFHRTQRTECVPKGGGM